MRASLVRDVLVRRASAADEPFIVRLSELAFSEYNNGARRTALGMLKQAGTRTFVACQGSRPVGFVMVTARPGASASIDAIAVARAERGRGVGKSLMLAAERDARARGVRSLSLVTAHANLAALDLFLRAGFAITRRVALRYARGQDACCLEKVLE